MWKVIFTFNRTVVEHTGTKEEIMEAIRVTVWCNEDCVSYTCHRIG